MDGITRFLRETGSEFFPQIQNRPIIQINATPANSSLTRPIHYFQMDQNETCLHTKILHNRCFQFPPHQVLQ